MDVVEGPGPHRTLPEGQALSQPPALHTQDGVPHHNLGYGIFPGNNRVTIPGTEKALQRRPHVPRDPTPNRGALVPLVRDR
jgi:hypothetical protein